MTGQEPWNQGRHPLCWTPTPGARITNGIPFGPCAWWEKTLNFLVGLGIFAAVAWLLSGR